MNSIGSWLDENCSKHALVINIDSVIALVSVFRQSCESLMYLEILSKYGSTYVCAMVFGTNNQVWDGLVFRRVRPLIDRTITDKSRAD